MFLEAAFRDGRERHVLVLIQCGQLISVFFLIKKSVRNHKSMTRKCTHTHTTQKNTHTQTHEHVKRHSPLTSILLYLAHANHTVTKLRIEYALDTQTHKHKHSPLTSASLARVHTLPLAHANHTTRGSKTARRAQATVTPRFQADKAHALPRADSAPRSVNIIKKSR